MSFIVYTAYVIVRLLTEDGGSSESEGAAGSGGGSGGDGGGEISWPFAGASIGGADGRTMTATGWVAALSVGCLAATLGLWSTLLAGNGRAAAVTVAATGAGAGAGAGGSPTEKQDKACMVAVGKKNKMNERRPGMGWGDPGAVIMSPKEDMKVLVEGVGAKVGPPEARKLCQTCLVRKPIRSKVRAAGGGSSRPLFFQLFCCSCRCFAALDVIGSLAQLRPSIHAAQPRPRGPCR